MTDFQNELQDALSASYRVERELGGGGMSRVFVAEEFRLNRRVVVKVLSPELLLGISAERFEREILLAASLQQANIVPVLSAGDAGGTPYFVMPYVDGESLRVRLARGPLPIGEAISILRDVARALAYAHERGVVHRDIKPDNVLLSRGAAMVTDFGIAKALAASAAPGARGSTLTQIGTAIGTPAYMAPEQAAGDPGTDQRADIYAFGCLAYELLTGRPPFDGRTPQRLLAAHLSEVPRPVSELRPDTPPALATLVSRCLEKDPSARPSSADDLLAALDAVSTGDPSRQTALPQILIGGPGVLRRALVVYAVAFVAIAILAKAAIVGIGLPDWVFPGSLVVMALGLPVILFTAYAQVVARRTLARSPAFTPGGTPSPATHGTMATLAMKASPHLSWRRTALGGAYAIGAFVLLVGAFMLLRALGIGPAGSLLARGRFTAREPVIIADFAAQHTDTALGAVVSDAIRAGLAQSSLISLVSPTEVAASLRRMARPPTTRLDAATAREMALRDGVKAVVDGQVTGVGSGYIITVRLISADSGAELATFQETGDGPRGLIDASDKLARQLRAKIGESLRNVQATPALAQVTTPSLEALRSYSAGTRANSMEADIRDAIRYARQAVAADSEFGSAWRLLAVTLSNQGAPQASIDSASEHAYRYRDRLSERERLQTDAFYFMNGPHADRRRALDAYGKLIQRGDSLVAATNAGEVLRSERAFADAESLNVMALRTGLGSGIQYGNLIELQIDQGHLATAAKTLETWRQRSPTASGVLLHELAVRYATGDTARLRVFADSLRLAPDTTDRVFGLATRAALSLLHGRLADARSSLQELRPYTESSASSRLGNALFEQTVDAWFHGSSPAVVKRIDSALARTPLSSLPLADRPYFTVARAYAFAGAPDKASAILAEYRRDVTDTSRLRLQRPALHSTLGALALFRGDGRAALDEFRRGDVADDGRPARECAPCSDFELARAFDVMGQADSAIARYEAYVATPYWMKLYGNGIFPLEFGDELLLAGVEKRLGELYEAKGDDAKAEAHYARFVALWKNAAPELQPKVEEVKRRMARLSDPERPRPGR